MDGMGGGRPEEKGFLTYGGEDFGRRKRVTRVSKKKKKKKKRKEGTGS
jgi:hypothetical protein